VGELIRASVLERWHQYSEPLEGRVHSMYLDILGLVTTGVGNLIDTPAQAALLPWHHEKTGAPATRAEIHMAWAALKKRKDLASRHWKYAAELNDLRLTDAAIDALVSSKVQSNAAYLAKTYFLDFANWPADAQLAALSMAWAVGPGFPAKFPNWTKFAKVQDWVSAKACCKIREAGNPGVVPRNRAQELCHDNAATVRENGFDPSELHWPALLIDPITITASP
jgi:GH24 family phage-related lysozyme (muramidase)